MSTPEFLGTSSIQEFGFDIETISTMARLGIVFSGISTLHVDGIVVSTPRFNFIPETPMGRANMVAGHEDLDLLSICISDAQTLSYNDFASKYPSLGPYENE